MQRILRNSLQIGLIWGVLSAGCASARAADPTPVPSPSPPATRFRTPARQYGIAYSVKIRVAIGDFSWVVPVWIKPDQKESTFDVALMRLMGWHGPKFEFDHVSLAGVPLEKLHFGKAKSDWAYFPEFAKSCCVGVLGQDVLKNFELRFDPRMPTHVEWKRVETPPKKTARSGISPADLSGLFNLDGTRFKNRDLTAIPYVLDFSADELSFEDDVKPVGGFRKTPMFAYDILPPVRNVQVLAVARDLAAAAARSGLKPGVTITQVDGSPVGKLDKLELDQILLGRRNEKVRLTLKDKREITFDFKKNEFVAAPPVPRRSR